MRAYGKPEHYLQQVPCLRHLIWLISRCRFRTPLPKHPQALAVRTPQHRMHRSINFFRIYIPRELIVGFVRNQQPLVATRNFSITNSVTARTNDVWHRHFSMTLMSVIFVAPAPLTHSKMFFRIWPSPSSTSLPSEFSAAEGVPFPLLPLPQVVFILALKFP